MSTEIATKENSFAVAFEAQAKSSTAWLDRVRENAIAQFNAAGFPTTHEEEWKYTNVAALAKRTWKVRSAATVTADVANLRLPEITAAELIFINGKLQTGSRDSSFVAMGLAEAIDNPKYATLIREQLARHADSVANAFTALNTAFINDGAFVYIPKGVVLSAPVHLLFVSDGTQAETATFPRVLVVAEENSSLTLLESYSGESLYLTNAVVEIVLKDGARLEHFKVQRESVEAFHVASTVADLGPNTTYDVTTITFGAQLSRHDVRVTMDHEGAECHVDGLYLVTGSQHTDTHSVIDHRKPHCISHQLYKGILDGKSRAVFNGKVFVRHDAQKTDAMQTNKNLLLSNEARVDTKPQLEILADDVKCAHGAAVGQIDPEELFYLETRGIHPDLARNLLTYGFAEEVIGKIKIDSIREQLDEAVLHRLNARLEA